MVGAGGYFATSGLITGFLIAFLDGANLTDCYKSYVGDWEDIVKHKPIVSANELNQLYIGISSTRDGKEVYYGNAYVGPLNFTLNSITPITK
jgi:hypothetical protein